MILNVSANIMHVLPSGKEERGHRGDSHHLHDAKKIELLLAEFQISSSFSSQED